jgi:carboxyl-terminal processing protease
MFLGWLILAAGAPAVADDLPAPAAPLPGLAGIGAVLVDKGGTAVINEVIPHSPAAGAGLKAQDTIVWVDYRDVAGMKLEEVVSLIRGEPGTTVAITVKTPGDTKPHTYTLTRAPIMVGP